MSHYFISYTRETPAYGRFTVHNAVLTDKHPFEWLAAVNETALLSFALLTWKPISEQEANILLKAISHENAKNMYHPPLPAPSKER